MFSLTQTPLSHDMNVDIFKLGNSANVISFFLVNMYLLIWKNAMLNGPCAISFLLIRNYAKASCFFERKSWSKFCLRNYFSSLLVSPFGTFRHSIKNSDNNSNDNSVENSNENSYENSDENSYENSDKNSY